VTPPGHPTVRRVMTARVHATARVVASCHADERLVAWFGARGFATPSPPAPDLIASLSTRVRASANKVTVVAHAGRGQGLVQVSAVCAGGR
jgi:hypothetical protein